MTNYSRLADEFAFFLCKSQCFNDEQLLSLQVPTSKSPQTMGLAFAGGLFYVGSLRFDGAGGSLPVIRTSIRPLGHPCRCHYDNQDTTDQSPPSCLRSPGASNLL